MSNGTPRGGPHGWTSAYEPIEAGDETLHGTISGDRPRHGRSRRARSTLRPAQPITYADARGPHRPSGRRALPPPRSAARVRCWRCSGLPNSPEWDDRRPRRDGRRRHGHRRQSGVRRARAGRGSSPGFRARRSSSRGRRGLSWTHDAEAAGVRAVVALDDVEREGRCPRGRGRPHRAPSPCCRTRAAPPGCPRASCSPTRISRGRDQRRPLSARATALAVAALRSRHGLHRALCLPADLGRHAGHPAALRLRAVPGRSSAPGHASLVVPPPVMAALAGHPVVDDHDLSSLS